MFMAIRSSSLIKSRTPNDFWKFWTGQTISTLGSSFTSKVPAGYKSLAFNNAIWRDDGYGPFARGEASLCRALAWLTSWGICSLFY
jgi:hypothetical protein